MDTRYLLLLIFTILITFSCDDKNLLIQNDLIVSNDANLSKFRSSSIHKNIGYDWEKNTRVTIQGQNVILPWYNGAPASFPQHIFNDYKKSDGWVMIYNFITDNNVSLSNRYVFIFYNIFRGLMRIYYYNTSFPSQAGTSFAQITIHDNSTKLFNSSTTGRVCLPLDQQGSNIVYTTGISTTPVSGFYYGWNCFEVEISYDQYLKDKNVSMSISFYDQRVKTIHMTGNIDIKGSASYVTTNTNNVVGNTAQSVFNSIASAAGEEVEKIIFPSNFNTNKKEDSTKSIGPMIIGKAISSFISTAISGITKSWTSSWGRTNSQIKTVDIKLPGTITMNGTITDNIPPPVIPIQNILVPGALSGSSLLLPIEEIELGVWNIKTCKPAFIGSHTYPSIENYSHYPMHDNDYPVIGDFCKYIFIRTPIYEKDDIVLNDSVKKYIEKYEVQTNMFYKGASGEETIDNNTIIDRPWRHNGAIYYKISTDHRYHFDKSYWRMVNSNNFQRNETPTFYFEEKNFKFVAKVTLLLYPKAPYNTDVISLTRTFDCKIEKVPTPIKGRVTLGGY